MNEQLQNDLINLDQILEKVKHQGLEYLVNLTERPTSTKSTIQLNKTLNEIGSGSMDTLRLFNEKFEKLMVASSGPRYLGFVIGGATPASIVGDWLATIYDQNPQATSGEGDISAIIEIETITLLLDLFTLPKDFMGGFVTGATMSNFTCLGTARQWIGKQYGKDFAKDGVSEKIRILSALPHSSVIKSLSMLGIGSNNYERVKIESGNRERIDIEDLEEKIKALNGQPFILISGAGTVNTVDFDDFKSISKIKENHNFWWHIDGAFGAFAACSPKYKHLVNGCENADSITIDCHKWLNVPYESAIFLVKEQYKSLQTETFQNSNAAYLVNPVEEFSYLNFLPENSRRLKALPVWFSLMSYGKKGYQDIVEKSIDMANYFGQFIENSKDFELLAPVRLNNVCFTLFGEENQDKVFAFLKNLNETGKVLMTPTVYNSKKGIRASFVNWRTTAQDVEVVANEMMKLITTKYKFTMEISKHESEWLESEGAKMLMDLGVKQGDKVVDFGCGEGRYTIPLSQIVGIQGCVYSVEQDENAIAVVQKRLQQFSNPNIVKFLKVNKLETSEILQAKSIDAIFVFDVLQYVQDWDLLFRYFYNVIKPEGLVCIYPAAIPHPGDVDIKLAISKMEEIGFQYIKSNTFQMMHNVDMVNDVVYSFFLV